MYISQPKPFKHLKKAQLTIPDHLRRSAKKILTQKYFRIQIIFGPRNCWGPKKFFVIAKNLYLKKFFGQKSFWPKNCLGHKNCFRLNKFLGPKNFVGPTRKNVGSKSIKGEKKILLQKRFLIWKNFCFKAVLFLESNILDGWPK